MRTLRIAWFEVSARAGWPVQAIGAPIVAAYRLWQWRQRVRATRRRPPR